MSEIVPPKVDDVVAWVTVRQHSTGAISIQGTIGDPGFAISLLEHAIDAIRNQIRPKGELFIPTRDVDAVPNPKLTPVGDMRPQDRGDG